MDIEFKQLWPSRLVETTDNNASGLAAAPVPLPKEQSKVVRNKADSSSSTAERHQALKSYVTVPSQKRKRWEGTDYGRDVDELSCPSKRNKKNTRERRSHGRHSSADSSKKGDRNRHASIVVKPDLPSRIVRDFRGGSLQITISRGQ